MTEEELRAQAHTLGLTLTDEMMQKLREYVRLLLSWNEKINLTAIKTPAEAFWM